MSGLVLKLAPFERVLINGAVIENGDRRTRITILTPNANVLRLKDAIHPDDASTPVARVCYIAQLVLSGDADPVAGRDQILSGLKQLDSVFYDADSQCAISEARKEFEANRAYPGLRRLRGLLDLERRILRRGAA